MRRSDKRRLLDRINLEIELIEARQAADEAERRFEAEAGERTSHEAELARCADGVEGCIHWINTWVWTYDPRRIGRRDAQGQPLSPYLPFKLFPRQEELVRWVFARMEAEEEGAVDKSRDIGFTFLLGAVALHQWLFEEGFKATFGSRDADLVDKLGDPDSIFEKIRLMARRLPAWMMPSGFSWYRDSNENRLINPAQGAMITGAVGEDAGRGGRSKLVIFDEFAFVKRADAVARAVSANTDCVIWGSSSNGTGTMFYRKKRTLAPRQVFRFHYSDDPRKTAEWVAKKKRDLSADPTAWAREFEIDDTASVENICLPARWVQSAQRLAELEPALRPIGSGIAGVDVGAGKANSVCIVRHGPIIQEPRRRQGADTTETAYWALECCAEMGARDMNFDEPGVGLGVKSTLTKAEGYPKIRPHPINTGDPPTDRVWGEEDEDADEPARTSADLCGNLKAELWWLARAALQRTHEHVLFLLGEEGGTRHPVSDLIALPKDQGFADQLSLVKWGRNERGKIVIETKAQLRTRGIPSPDDADAFVLTFLEPENDGIEGLQIDASTFHRINPWKIGNRED